MHEITFQRCIEAGGLNRYLFEMANIREQVSWVTLDKEEATQKAIRLTEMAISKASQLQSLTPLKSPVEKTRFGDRRRYLRHSGCAGR